MIVRKCVECSKQIASDANHRVKTCSDKCRIVRLKKLQKALAQSDIGLERGRGYGKRSREKNPEFYAERHRLASAVAYWSNPIKAQKIMRKSRATREAKLTALADLVKFLHGVVHSQKLKIERLERERSSKTRKASNGKRGRKDRASR